ncbi:hypothetical protein Q3G72_013374 [Acer saccharum]|nr:hypothetical protein Q3G72_013374 [Acer saccharum]
MATTLGMGDLSPPAEHDVELRETDIIRRTRSSSHASQQQRTNDAKPSSVLVADTSVPTVPSSVHVANAVPDQLKRWFIEVINAIESLREEVYKNDLERKESDKVKEEQHKELVHMI